MKFKIRFADQIVGIFSIAAIAGLILLVFFIGASQHWFAHKNNYYTMFESGSGLSVGADLTYKGFSIGKINSVKLQGEMVRVDYYVLGEYTDYVRENSLVELSVSPIGLGSSFVLYPGKSQGILADGSEIYRLDSGRGKELIAQEKVFIEKQSDSIAVLMNKVSTLLDNVNSILYNLDGALDGTGKTPVAQIFSNLTSLTSNINGVLQLLQDKNGAVTRLLGPKLAQELTSVLENLTAVTSNFTGISSNADKIVSNAVGEIDSALGQINTILVQVQDVLTGVKNNPLIKGGVPDRSAESSATTHIRSTEF